VATDGLQTRPLRRIVEVYHHHSNSPLTAFNSSRRLRSVRVDKELIRRLEDYLGSELLQLNRLPKDALPDVLSVTVTDAIGTEVLSSISEHLPAHLPDSVSRVIISFRPNRYSGERPGETSINVKISFGRARYQNELDISASGASAKDKVVAVRSAILGLLEPHWTNNRLFHPDGFAWALFFTIGTGAGAVFIGFLASSGGLAPVALWSLIISMSIGGYFFLGMLNPWATFDTRVDRENEKWSGWLKFGLASFILFGTILSLIRQKLLGF
jgi:hypothetical protein